MSETRFRPTDLEATKDGGSRFLGFLPVAIMGYENKSHLYSWADVFISVTLQIDGSQYATEMKVAGSYDKEANGNIKSCTLLKRLYWLFDVVGFEGGPDVQGNWVDKDGDEIKDLCKHLEDNHSTNPLVPKFEYYAYVYKEVSKKDPSKSYTTVYPKLTPNTAAGMKDLEGYIAFIKSKGLIREWDGKSSTKPVSNGEGDVNSTSNTF